MRNSNRVLQVETTGYDAAARLYRAAALVWVLPEWEDLWKGDFSEYLSRWTGADAWPWPYPTVVDGTLRRPDEGPAGYREVITAASHRRIRLEGVHPRGTVGPWPATRLVIDFGPGGSRRAARELLKQYNREQDVAPGAHIRIMFDLGDIAVCPPENEEDASLVCDFLGVA